MAPISCPDCGSRTSRPEETLNAVEAFRQQPDVLYAEPNYILRADATPNDPSFNQLYAPGLMGSPQAWDTRTGSTGAGRVVIGVIDQGIDFNHQDLAPTSGSTRRKSPATALTTTVTASSDDVRGFNFVNNNGTTFSGSANEDHASHVSVSRVPSVTMVSALQESTGLSV
jgi:hypothetical protein